MAGSLACTHPLAGAGFGGRIQDPGGAAALVAAAEAAPEALPRMLAEAHGLLLLPGMGAMAEAPELLLRLSRVFGPEVEDYRTTGMAPTWCTRRCRKSSSSPTPRRSSASPRRCPTRR